MRHKLKVLDAKLRELSPPVFIVVMTILSIVGILPLLPVLHVLVEIGGPRVGPSLAEESMFFQFVGSVLLAPLLETLIYQTAPILILRKYSSARPAIIILASSILFAVGHDYDISYIFYAFLIGLLLAYSYVIYLEKTVSAFWVVAAIHSLRNLFSLVIYNV